MRKRSFWRGLLIGLGVTLLTMVLVPMLIAGMRYAYFAIQGVQASSVSNDTFMAPLSVEWTILQVLAFVGAIASGFSAARWSKRGAWAAPCVLAILWLGLSAFDPPPFESNVVWLMYITYSSIGYMVGAVLYKKKFEHLESDPA